MHNSCFHSNSNGSIVDDCTGMPNQSLVRGHVDATGKKDISNDVSGSTAEIDDEKVFSIDVATTSDMAEMAKYFEHAILVNSTSTSVKTNANNNADNNDGNCSYDINVGNLLTACDRLENVMRQIGFTQSANDISGNVNKIRNIYNRLPTQERDSLVFIIQHEFETGVHGSSHVNTNTNNNKDNHHYTTKFARSILYGPTLYEGLSDSSATIGFLWLGRSINYQNYMFRHMLDHEDEDEDEKSSPYNAARYAFDKALKSHLSWPLQKVSQLAMKRLKPLRKRELFCRIGGFQQQNSSYSREEEREITQRDLRRVVNSWQHLLNQWKQIFMDLDLAMI
mmetsp:Transcript_66264/g.74204  ORF Transcript_66264/g.74204 Transcript_66264/m.74204 type:complete len:337 (-) Transcript_66264:74-1084(-)